MTDLHQRKFYLYMLTDRKGLESEVPAVNAGTSELLQNNCEHKSVLICSDS